MTNPTDTSAEYIAALLDGVTEGPWEDRGGEDHTVLAPDGMPVAYYVNSKCRKFIAASRDLVPALRQALTNAEAHIARLTPAPDADLDALVFQLEHAHPDDIDYRASATALTALRAQNAALRAERDELTAAIDSIETSEGLTSNGNLWRFWANRAREMAPKIDALRASEAAALERVTVLTEALKEGRRAIGDHFAPSDCYATGPMTGDTYRDLVQCPACSFIAMYEAAVAAPQLASDMRISGELSALLRNWCVWGGSISARHAKEIRALITPAQHDALAAHVAAEVAKARAEDAAVSQAAQDVLAERQRQISAEGWTQKHDDQHSHGEMAAAAACYALVGSTDRSRDAFKTPLQNWPWAASWWKPTTPRRDLVKAGALILAEIERLDRALAGKGE